MAGDVFLGVSMHRHERIFLHSFACAADWRIRVF